MDKDGYKKYEAHFINPPHVTVEWHDDETEATGYLVVDSFKNGAAGGGTRMRKGATREEALFLAKTMAVKFRLAGPDIGGAKSVIDFSPDDSRAEAVLRRWFKSIGLYLRNCYGTGGDLGVNDEIVQRLVREELDIKHPQEGIVRGYLRPDETGLRNTLSQLGYGVGIQAPFENSPTGPFTIETMITGYGVARSLDQFYATFGETLQGKRVLVEGFGIVGGAAAYYLAKAGARIVAITTIGETEDLRRCAVDDGGLDVSDLLLHRRAGRLPKGFPEAADSSPFDNARGDIFIPAAKSHTIDRASLDQLYDNGITVIACGANSPFSIDRGWDLLDLETAVRDYNTVQREADERFSVIPDFIANCGTARLFAYLMQEGVPIDCEAIFANVDKTIVDAVTGVLRKAGGRFGLLDSAYDLYLPDIASGRRNVARAV